MTEPLVECVPNFSEGRDPEIIGRITDAIQSVEGVKLLDVDPGKATHRTVVTLVGPPPQVVEAAVRAARVAAELIDMSRHQGEHPRFGAMDVCPLVPVAGISMAETVTYAHELARRLGEEVGLTIYCYEHAARRDDRRNLAAVRAGEYEGLKEKLADPRWQPDFGPAVFNARSGATAVGARNFLVAYNINLNTTSTRRANAIAFDVREKGRKKREGNLLTGPVVRDGDGREVWIQGSLKSVKAIGWFIREYGIAQISMNLTDIATTPIHVAFDEVCRAAAVRGIRVTGSELVGLVPLQAMLEAGRYFLHKQQRSVGIPDRDLVRLAVRSLGLDELGKFQPREKIIEYAMEKKTGHNLVDLSLKDFVFATAGESPAPGGGSVAAAVGALAAALGTMVANLSAHKRGWDDRWEKFSGWAETGKASHDRLLALVDEDTEAFNAVMEAFRLPAGTSSEKEARSTAVQSATRRAMEVPYRVMEAAHECMVLLEAMAGEGLPSSASDAGVGALCARAAVRGAFLNVRINAAGLEDKVFADDLIQRGRRLEEEAAAREKEILALVESRL
ncbi:MAG: glutamate formimidoyltransferase [Acidobacteria bacterium]|nr:MAG: glutamate formimidoyltransferase [Acidobacteriota bacterium]